MTLSKDEAAQALGEIDAAGARMTRLRGYGEAANHLVVWGVVWLVANTVSDLVPAYGVRAWLAATSLGILASAALVAMRVRRRAREPGVVGPSASWRFAANFLVIFAFFAAIFFVIGPLSSRQGNAVISLFWCFAYMLRGVWAGWRLFAIGAITALLVLFGFVAVTEHFALWMGVVGGGSLILGGLWLRRV